MRDQPTLPLDGAPPRKATRRCRVRGCRGVTTDGPYCLVHAGSWAQRGGYTYDHRWRAYRRAYLTRHRVCAECGAPSEVVDHIVPVAGQRDRRFWAAQNHQALCRRCHARKSNRERAMVPDGGRGF